MEFISIVISVAALIVSFVTTLISVRSSKKISSAEYSVSEEVKNSTVKLVAVLRSIAYKGASIRADGYKNIDIAKEKEFINEFVFGSTSFAYHSLVRIKTGVGQNGDKEWRIFFLRLIQLLETNDIGKAAEYAVGIEETYLHGLTEDDLAALSKVRDFSEIILETKEQLEGNTIIQVLMDINKK